MSINKLFIVDDDTGEIFSLARSLGGDGWRASCTIEELDKWINFSFKSEKLRDKNAATRARGRTHLRLVTDHEFIRNLKQIVDETAEDRGE